MYKTGRTVWQNRMVATSILPALFNLLNGRATDCALFVVNYRNSIAASAFGLYDILYIQIEINCYIEKNRYLFIDVDHHTQHRNQQLLL